MLVFLLLSVAGAQLLANDLCDGARNVTDGFLQAGTLSGVPVPGYTSDYDCLGYNDVYFTYTSTCVGQVAFSVSSENYVYVGAYTGSACTALGLCHYSSGYTAVTANLLSTAVGDKFYFGVGSPSPAPLDPLEGAFVFNVTCTPQAVAAGDTCPHAIAYTGPTTIVSTADAYPSRQTPGSYCSGQDIFIVYNATCNGDATVTSAPFGNLAVFYYGDCNKIVGSEWQRTCETDGDVSFPVRANELYYVAVGGSADTSYNISITCAANTRPVNDECQGALTVTSPSTISFDTSSTTGGVRSVPSDSCANFDKDVWFTYNATCDGDLVVQFNSSNAYAVAYAGSCGLNVRASDCLNRDSLFAFPVWTGQTYKIALGAYFDEGFVEANFTCVNRTRPANDKCANAQPSATNTSYTFDQRLATTESYERSLSCGRNLANDFFYLYTACAGTNQVSVTTNATYGGIAVGAFLGCGREPLACAATGSSSLQVSFDAPQTFPIYVGVGFPTTDGFAQVNFSCTPFPPTDAPTRSPTQPTTAVPTPKPTTAAPTQAPTAPTAPSQAPTNDANETDTSAPTLSGATTLQLGLASLLGFAMLA